MSSMLRQPHVSGHTSWSTKSVPAYVWSSWSIRHVQSRFVDITNAKRSRQFKPRTGVGVVLSTQSQKYGLIKNYCMKIKWFIKPVGVIVEIAQIYLVFSKVIFSRNMICN